MKTSSQRSRATKTSNQPTRRIFLQTMATWAAMPLVAPVAAAEPGGAVQAKTNVVSAPNLDAFPTGSDVGSLYPFIQSQARTTFPLSYLNPQFHDLPAWKKVGRAKLLDLLHYAPPACDPKPEGVEVFDAGDYKREKIYFNT